MSDIKKLDDHLKKSFSGYAPDVPPHIWENIVAGRKRKKPAGFWLNRKIVGAVLLAITLTGGILLLIKNKESNSKIIAHENNVSNKQAGTETQVPPAVGTQRNSNDIATGNKNETARQGTTNTQTATNSNQDFSAHNLVKTDVQNSSAKNTSGEMLSSTTTAKKINTANTRRNMVKKRSTGNFMAQSTGAGETVTETADENNKDIQEPPVVQQDFLISRILYRAEKLTAASLANENGKKTEMKAIQIPGCPSDKDAAGNKQYWEIYAGPDYAIKKYVDTANSILLEKRKASTSFRSAFSAGVRYTKVFNNGMSVRGGLNFSQINEKFSYAQSNIVQLTYEINQNGDTVNSYYVRGTKYKTTYNHYRTIDVPLMVGYELGNGRLHANINAGAVVNIYSWQKGETLDTSFQPVSFTSEKNNSAYQYKTNVGIGFMAGVSFYYKLNERLHLLAEPYYRYNFSPMNKETLSIQEKFSTIGLRLGLRIDLQ